MNHTKIEWVKNPDGTQGYTWNPITGCLNGCEYCYARKLANTRLKKRYLANEEVAITGFDVVYIDGNDPKYQDPFYPRFWEDKLEQVLHRRIDSPLRGIFCCDMSDLFGIGIPEEWTQKVLGAIEANFYDRFYLLTKQPQNLIKFKFPDNCWVGVSITNNDAYYQSNDVLSKLKSIKASVKYISFEPLLERILAGGSGFLAGDLEYAGISWVIIGAQTKPYKPPKIEWVKEIVEACDKAGIPVFLKNNLRPASAILPADTNLVKNYELRQEMPTTNNPMLS
jgi:protein gp37